MLQAVELSQEAGTSFGEPWWSLRNEAEAFEHLSPTDDFDDLEFGRATAGELEGAPAGPLSGEHCRWARPAEALGNEAELFASSDSFVLKPSSTLNDRAVLTAIAALSTRADLMVKLFASVANASRGAYTISLYRSGAWTPVLVDTQLPVSGNGELLCATSATVPSFAPALLEKAVAKLYGGYSQLARLSLQQGLVALTGGSIVRRLLQEEDASNAKLEVAQDMRSVDVDGDLLLVQLSASRAASLKQAGKNLHGLNPEEFYVVLGFVMVGAMPFARLHTPWGRSPWSGPWSTSGTEWGTEYERAGALRRARLHSESQSEWWMPAAFLQLFDERVTCRLFRDITHRCACADAWDDHTAGGPPMPSTFEKLEVLGAGTWVLNPQFGLAMADYKTGPAEVTLSLLYEPEEGASPFEPIFASLHVIRTDARARSWGIQPSQLVAASGPNAGAEQTVTFHAYSKYAYNVVPSSAQKGRFLLRGWSARPFTLHKTRSLDSTTVRGSWYGALAGGPRNAASWSANPQYWLSLPRRAFVLVTLERMDGAPLTRQASVVSMAAGDDEGECSDDGGSGVAGSDADGGAASAGGVGVTLVVLRGEVPIETKRRYLHARARSVSPPGGPPRSPTPQSSVRPGSAAFFSPRSRRHALDPSLFSTAAVRDCSKLPHELKLRATPREVVGEVRLPGTRMCSLLLNLDGDKPYVVVPSLERAGVEASYRLRVTSAAAAHLAPISLNEHAIVHGRWTERSSCGCHLDVWSERQQRWLRNSRFLSNPQIQLRLDTPGEVRIRLQRGKLKAVGDEAEREDRNLLLRSTEKYYSAMLGLYVLRGKGLGPTDRLKLPARGYAGLDVAAEVAFVPLERLEATLQLKPLEKDSPYVIVPCLFGEGLTGSFTLEVTSEAGMRLHAVDETVPSLSLSLTHLSSGAAQAAAAGVAGAALEQ